MKKRGERIPERNKHKLFQIIKRVNGCKKTVGDS